MGFGVAAATALLGATVLVGAYNVTGAWFDLEADLNEARAAADARAADLRGSAFTVDDVSHTPVAGVVTLTLSNTGAVTLDADDADVLLDGVLYAGGTRTVTGHAGSLWHPAETLTIQLTQAQLAGAYVNDPPARAAVVAATGAQGFWGA